MKWRAFLSYWFRFCYSTIDSQLLHQLFDESNAVGRSTYTLSPTTKWINRIHSSANSIAGEFLRCTMYIYYFVFSFWLNLCDPDHTCYFWILCRLYEYSIRNMIETARNLCAHKFVKSIIRLVLPHVNTCTVHTFTEHTEHGLWEKFKLWPSAQSNPTHYRFLVSSYVATAWFTISRISNKPPTSISSIPRAKCSNIVPQCIGQPFISQ